MTYKWASDDPDYKPVAVTRRAFVPIFRLDQITNTIFFLESEIPYCDGDLERWGDEGGR